MFTMFCAPVSRQFCVRSISSFSKEVLFNPENIEKTMAQFRLSPSINMQTVVPTTRAAVLIPICVVNDKVSLLYTLRSSNVKLHRGQVSFPGGKEDPSDKSLEDTALRETFEEIGISPNDITIWGHGNIVVTRENTSIIPVVGQIKETLDLQNIEINAREVEEVFVIPLEELCDPKKLGKTQFKNSFTVPVFLAGIHRVWGFTAIITHFFLKSLLPSDVYKHNIRPIPTVK